MAEKPQEQDEAAAAAQQVKLDANVQFAIEGAEFSEPEWAEIARWLIEAFGASSLNEWLLRKWAQFNDEVAAEASEEVEDGDWVLFVYRELIADPPGPAA